MAGETLNREMLAKERNEVTAWYIGKCREWARLDVLLREG